MRLGIVAIGLIFLSCNDAVRQDISENKENNVIGSDNLPQTNGPAIFSTGASDTVISFSVEGSSAEGSEIKAHYINDTIVQAQWDMFGETGKTHIVYDFLNHGLIRVTEKQYSYKVQLSEVASPKDIIVKDTISYLLDTSGMIKTVIQKDFTHVYPHFKTNVPLVLKKQ